jgi:hypothetical protein
MEDSRLIRFYGHLHDPFLSKSSKQKHQFGLHIHIPSVGRVNQLLSKTKTKTKHPKTTTRLHPQHPSKTAFSISQLLPHANAAPNASLSRPGISHLANHQASTGILHPSSNASFFPSFETGIFHLSRCTYLHVSEASLLQPRRTPPAAADAHASHTPPCPIPPRHTAHPRGLLIGGGNVTGTVTSPGCLFPHTAINSMQKYCMQTLVRVCNAMQLIFRRWAISLRGMLCYSRGGGVLAFCVAMDRNFHFHPSAFIFNFSESIFTIAR